MVGIVTKAIIVMAKDVRRNLMNFFTINSPLKITSHFMLLDIYFHKSEQVRLVDIVYTRHARIDISQNLIRESYSPTRPVPPQ